MIRPHAGCWSMGSRLPADVHRCGHDGHQHHRDAEYGGKEHVMDQPDLTGAVVYVETADPPVAGGTSCPTTL